MTHHPRDAINQYGARLAGDRHEELLRDIGRGGDHHLDRCSPLIGWPVIATIDPHDRVGSRRIQIDAGTRREEFVGGDGEVASFDRDGVAAVGTPEMRARVEEAASTNTALVATPICTVKVAASSVEFVTAPEIVARPST